MQKLIEGLMATGHLCGPDGLWTKDSQAIAMHANHLAKGLFRWPSSQIMGSNRHSDKSLECLTLFSQARPQALHRLSHIRNPWAHFLSMHPANNANMWQRHKAPRWALNPRLLGNNDWRHNSKNTVWALWKGWEWFSFCTQVTSSVSTFVWHLRKQKPGTLLHETLFNLLLSILTSSWRVWLLWEVLLDSLLHVLSGWLNGIFWIFSLSCRSSLLNIAFR